MNVFIFAFNSDVSPLPVMTNDYGNKLGRGRRVAEERYMYIYRVKEREGVGELKGLRDTA